MGRRPIPDRSAATRSGKPPMPPPGPGGVGAELRRFKKLRIVDALTAEARAETASGAVQEPRFEVSERLGMDRPGGLQRLLQQLHYAGAISTSDAREMLGAIGVPGAQIAGHNSVQIQSGGRKGKQIAGDGSVQIQSGRDITNVTISATNGSFAAWNVNGPVDMWSANPSYGRPPPPPIDWVETESVAWKPTLTATGVDGHRWNRRGAAKAFLIGHGVMMNLLIVWQMLHPVSLAATVGTVVNGIALGAWGFWLAGAPATGAAAADQTEAEPEPDPKPVETPKRQKVSAWDTRSFTAVCDCPNCGTIALHAMREPQSGTVCTDEFPSGKTDPPDAVVIRQCDNCSQEWGEK